MKKAYVFCVILLIISTITIAQESPSYQWAKMAGSTSSDKAVAVTTSISGEVYMTGNFAGTVDFDPGPGVTNLTAFGGDDVFVAKYDPSGILVWAVQLGGTAGDYASAITIDGSGSILTTGYFYGNCDFDPGPSTFSISPAGGCDIYISKLHSDGSFDWAKAYRGVNIDTPASIAVDGYDNVYTTGYFFGTVDFDPSAATANLSTTGGTDAFVAKLSSAGNYVWAKKIGGSGGDGGSSIVVDNIDQCYVTGYFSASADFDPGAGTSNMTSAGSTDIFILNLDQAGDFMWAKRIGGTEADYCSSTYLSSSSDIYLTGSYKNTVDFDPGAPVVNLTSAGQEDIFVCALQPMSGDFLWAKSMGGPLQDLGTGIQYSSGLGIVYLTGHFRGTADYDPSVTTYNLTSDSNDVFICGLDVLGDFLFASKIGGDNDDKGNGIAVSSNEIYIAGYFSTTADFDPSPAINTMTSSGSSDIFLGKYVICSGATLSTSVTNACQGESNGTATVIASGGVMPYTYLWSTIPAQTAATATGLVGGIYSVTVTDGNSCSKSTAVTVTENPLPLVDFTGFTSGCVGEPENFTNTGSSVGVSWYWDFGSGSTPANSTLQNPTGITWSTAGTKNISLTTTNITTGCSASITKGFVINPTPTTPTVSSNSPLNVGEDLTLSASFIAGATYSWVGPGGFTSSLQNPTISNVSPSNAGTYSVTATVNGCTSSAGTTSVVVVTISITTSTNNVTCYGGSNGAAAVVSVTGGSAPFTYAWSTIPVQTTQAIFNLTAGTYIVTVSDSFGYTATASVIIGQPADITIFTNTTNVSCFDFSNGSANAIAGGGTSPFTYAWNTFPIQNTANASNLPAGNFVVTATDNNGCTATQNVTISQPTPLNTAISIVNADCGISNGSATASVTGGVGSYSYLWNSVPAQTSQAASGLPDGMYAVTVTDGNGCSLTSAAVVGIIPSNFNLAFNATLQAGSAPFTATFNNTTAGMGNYDFTWYWGDGNSSSDDNATVFYTYNYAGIYDVALVATNTATGCTDTLAKHPYINVTGTGCGYTAGITPSGTINACEGDTVVLNASTNAVPPFTYQWNVASVTISGADSNSLAVNYGGYYSVTIIKNGCPVTSSAVLVNFYTNPQKPGITSAGTITPCVGGTVTLTAAAGYSSYLWNTGATTQSILVNSSGTFSVEGFNSNGCSSISDPFTVNASLLPPPEICIVTVDSISDHNLIVWEKIPTQLIQQYKVYSETNQAGVYALLGNVPYDSLSFFIDTLSNPQIRSYRYKISAVDTCGDETALSMHHKTLHLMITEAVPQGYNLDWQDSYEGFTFLSYVIYRGTTLQNMVVIDTIASNLSSYTDTTSLSGTLYYAVAALKPGGSCLGTKDQGGPYSQSVSNIEDNEMYVSISGIVATENIFIYPNPATDEITIDIRNLSVDKNRIDICNIQGQTVKSMIINGNKANVNISELPMGMYFVKIEASQRFFVKKFIKD